MRIVIDISEDIREQLLDICNFGLEIPLGLQNKMIMAITNGTVLPKGHGDLIDRDELKKHKYHDNNRYENAVSIAQVDWAKAIIEADKEAKNEEY